MADKSVGDFFLDAARDQDYEPAHQAGDTAVIVPSAGTPVLADIVPAVESVASPVARPPSPAPEPVAPAPADTPTPSQVPVRDVSDREGRIAAALDGLMRDNHDIQAAALVSLDGFTMASALPAGMQEDRVGAMSAAILGLGERAAVELGKGQLSQVIIEGEDGYVALIAAGDRAVLTCLSDADAKLGLVLYDMREAADTIADTLG